MTLSILTVALVCVAYLTLLFLVAYITEKGFVSDKVVFHPVTYVFSLGIFASAIAYYGVVELAQDFGYASLTYYFGTGLLFLFAPFLLKPLIELSRRFQITSMADLLTFRYNSNRVGAFATLCMLIMVMPLVALQFQAVAETIDLLTSDSLTDNAQYDDTSEQSSGYGKRDIIALLYCIVLIFFTLIYGSNKQRHKGLITAMAFESIIKLVGILAVGLYSLFVVFGGLTGLDTWLHDNPEAIQNLYEPLRNTQSHMLLLVFLSTTVALPHIFYLAVAENHAKRATYTVTWAMPLFLLLMALPIFPILWAGTKLGISSPTEYFSLSVPFVNGNLSLTIISFVAGLSASTGAIISISLALSTMVLNHWILPSTALTTKSEVYGQLVSLRRILIVAIIGIAFVFYTYLNGRYSLIDLAFVSFIASLQLMPGILCVTHWARANRKGLIAGITVGMSVWLLALMLPMHTGDSFIAIGDTGWVLKVGIQHWNYIALWSISLNVLAFALVSVFTQQTDAERYSAELCAENELSHPVRLILDIHDPEEMIERLKERLGDYTAHREVTRALKTLGMTINERRPYALRKLRDEVEANLSGLLGIALASEIMDTLVPFRVPEGQGITDINLIEERLYHYRDHLSGMAAELNSLRLYHRSTLEQLPIAICSVAQDREVLMWNRSMHRLSNVPSTEVTGSYLDELAEPWRSVLVKFADSDKPSSHKIPVEVGEDTIWVSLYKANIPSSADHQIQGQVILVEDITEMQILEKELVHSERLASVGRLAAGVAHEIGNPVTGIDCLAQNLKYDSEDPEIHETAEQILSQTKRVSRIVQSLVSFSHAGHNTHEFEPVCLYKCAQEGIDLIALQKEKKQMVYINKIPEETMVMGDYQRIIQIFINLLANARDAAPEQSEVIVALESTAQARSLRFSITDQGPGIPIKLQDRILEPFFTTKEPGEGTGLGLAMVYSIIEDHQGQLEIISPVDKVLQKGTKFVINLPSVLASSGTLRNTNSLDDTQTPNF